MTTSILAEELAELNTRMEEVRKRHDALTGELQTVDTDLGKFAADRARFDALREVCQGLDKLGELSASDLFWDDASDSNRVSYLESAKKKIENFDGQIGGILNRQTSLKNNIKQCLTEMEFLSGDVEDAYAREERREEEYFVEREISPVPNYTMAMPWGKDTESEKHFRKDLKIAFMFYLVFCLIVALWKLPPPVRPVVAVVPERLVSMLRNVPPKPQHVSNRKKDEKKPEKELAKAKEQPKEQKPEIVSDKVQEARKKAESSGVLAFKDALKDMMDDAAPATRLGTEARLSNNPSSAPGQARASRSLVAMPNGSGTSGGIGGSGISRNIGGGNGNKIGGVGFARVESGISGLGDGNKPISSGPGPARTDEEIQIVFDRYKASLYRLYNAELRKIPTLKGKILLKITIEPGGEVSACSVQSNDLASPDLVSQVVERVKRFNFGPKEDVSRITILYPIDFLPAA
jgi:hypothetical protein